MQLNSNTIKIISKDYNSRPSEKQNNKDRYMEDHKKIDIACQDIDEI